MEYLSYFTTKPIILLMEIIFMVFGRVYDTQLVVLLVCVVMNLFLRPLFLTVDHRIKSALCINKKAIKNAPALCLSFAVHIMILFATTSFFMDVNIIKGKSLGPIANLGAGDALIDFSSFSVNVLPVVFFVISLLSVLLSKDRKRFHKAFMVVLYLCITVFLYFSTAGNALFWIAYAVFSLIEVGLKELFKQEKIKALFKENPKMKKLKGNPALFFMAVFYLIILTSLFIPTNIMKVSAAEFVDVLDVKNPLHYLFYSFAYAFGTFGIWFSVFYLISKETVRYILDRVFCIICFVAFINYVVAGSYLGETSPALFYFEFHDFGTGRILISLLLSLVVGAAILILMEKSKTFVQILIGVEIGMVLFSTVTNCIKINSVYSGLDYLDEENEYESIIHLSQNGENVVVLILDRALGTEVPYIFNEKPELKEQFDGFVYYPNTVSFGGYTNTGIPAVYGGYEYTPERINARSDESLEKKHNEALKVMPVLFAQNDFDVTVCDPVYAGYNWIPDLSIYDDYPDISAFNTDGKFNDSAPDDYVGPKELLKRNFFVHSLMKTAPLNWQLLLYNEGQYCNPNFNYSKKDDSVYQSEGYDADFLDAYLVLTSLNEITEIEEENNNNFLLFYNATPHMPNLLQEPDYVPSRIVDNREYHKDDRDKYIVDGVELPMQSAAQLTHYDVNMASYLLVGKWLDYLKENGCYDNTRIIIVADHGRNVHETEKIGESDIEMEFFFPALMVKDFNAKGFSVSEDVMTNADVVSLASTGVIPNPVNPFSGNALDGHEKESGELKVFYSEKCNLEDNHGNVFVKGKWFSVHGNPREIDNWSYLGEDSNQ